MQVLLIGGEPTVSMNVLGTLRTAGYSADWASDLSEGRVALSSDFYDLILLDLDVPNEDGLLLLTEHRQDLHSAWVMVLTDCDRLSDETVGLESGVDDFLVKPLDFDELLSRISGLAYRHSSRSQYQHGDLRLDCVAHRAFRGDAALPLLPREFDLLKALIQEPNRVFARSELAERLPGRGSTLSNNAIDVHIHRLRGKIGRDRILTLRGFGYRLARAR
jgi:two-component system response regulator QseB